MGDDGKQQCWVVHVQYMDTVAWCLKLLLTENSIHVTTFQVPKVKWTQYITVHVHALCTFTTIMPHTCDKGAALPRVLFSLTEESNVFKEPEEVKSGLLWDNSGSVVLGTSCWGPDPSQQDTDGVVIKSVM